MTSLCRLVALATLGVVVPSVALAQPSTAARIATLLGQDEPLPVDTRDVTTPSKLRDVLVAAGFVRVAAGRFAFTRRGLAASRACPRMDALDDPATRCFSIARRTFEGIVATRDEAATIDAEASRLWFFRFHAEPSSALGARLAASGAVVCNDRDGRTIAWHGRRTTVYGEYTRTVGRLDDALVGADCPRDARDPSPADAP